MFINGIIKNKIIILVLCIFIYFFVSAFSVNAQDGFWEGIGAVSSFGKPFWADMHSTIVRAEIAYATNSPDYDWGKDNSTYRPYVFANLGVNLPVWAGNFKDKKYGFSITLPFMIDTWYDRFEWETSPIINTAWWFGVFDLGFINRLDSPVQVLPFFHIHNFAVKFCALKHESTHLGDELTIFRKDENFPITRVDVIKNYAELTLIINDPDNKPRSNHGFKFGMLFNYNFRTGWYDILETEADPDAVNSSKFPFEFYAQYQYQSPLFGRGFQIITSFEYRLRERFNYHYSTTGANREFRSNSSALSHNYNIFAGVRFDNQKDNYFSKIGIGIRYYQGINPYGQFRSMPNFRQWGISVIFE